MSNSRRLKYNIVKNLLNITIHESDEHSKSFESLNGNLDYQSLHPNYESKCFQVYEQVCKVEDKKLCVQIENFIKVNSLNRERQTLEISSIYITQEQNEIERIVRGKMEVKKNKIGCTDICVIG